MFSAFYDPAYNLGACDLDFDGDSPACPPNVELAAGGYSSSSGSVSLTLLTACSKYGYTGIYVTEVDPSSLVIDPKTSAPTFPDGKAAASSAVTVMPSPLPSGWKTPCTNATGAITYTINSSQFPLTGTHTLYIWSSGVTNATLGGDRVSDVPAVLSFTVP